MASIRVEVVAATGVVWEGDAASIIARTTEGDIGILAGHEPLLGALAPCAVEIETQDGKKQVAFVDGGYVSVADNRVSVLSQYARMAADIDAAAAQKELDAAQKAADADGADEDAAHQYRVAQAQMRAVDLSSGTVRGE